MPRYRYIDVVIYSVIIHITIMYSFIHYGKTRGYCNYLLLKGYIYIINISTLGIKGLTKKTNNQMLATFIHFNSCVLKK